MLQYTHPANNFPRENFWQQLNKPPLALGVSLLAEPNNHIMAVMLGLSDVGFANHHQHIMLETIKLSKAQTVA